MALTIIFAGDAYAKVWNYTQLTDMNLNNRHPSINGTDIVWVGYDTNGKYAIMHHDLNTKSTESLTGKITGHFGMATVNNGLVAIRSYDRKDSQNYYVYSLADQSYQKIFTAPVGSFDPFWGYQPSYHSIDPTINNGEVAFAAWDGHDYEIMSWKNGVTTQITNNDTDDYEPQVWNGKLSWTGWGGDATKQDIFYYEDGQISQITSRKGKDEDSFISDGKIAWTGQSYEAGDGGFNIYTYDIATKTTTLAGQLPGQDYEPVIYQNTLAWHNQSWNAAAGKQDYTTHYFDGYKLDELRYGAAGLDMIGPAVYQDTVVFSAHDGTNYEMVTASYKTGGYNPDQYQGYFRDAVTVGDIAYVAQGNMGIGVYDLSNPSAPKLIERAKIGSGGTAFDLEVYGNKLYSASREGGIDVFDLSTSGAPSRTGNIAVAGAATKLLQRDGTLYVGGREGGLSVVDITSSTPSIIGHLNLPGNTFGMDIKNSVAYVAGYANGLHIVDLADKTKPTLVNTLEQIGKIWDVNISKNTAFLSVSGFGLLAYDITAPLVPSLLGSLAMPNGNDANGWLANFEMIIRDNYAFVSAGTQGIFAVDISDPSKMRIIERYETPGFAWNTIFFGKYMLSQDYQNGFNLYDVTDYYPEKNAATPIPAPLLLMGTGLIGLLWTRRRNATKKVNAADC